MSERAFEKPMSSNVSASSRTSTSTFCTCDTHTYMNEEEASHPQQYKIKARKPEGERRETS